jgi:hypothetical protein
MRRSLQGRSMVLPAVVDAKHSRRKRTVGSQIDSLGLVTRVWPGRGWGRCYQFTQAGCTQLQSTPGCALFTRGEAQELVNALAKELGYPVVVA